MDQFLNARSAAFNRVLNTLRPRFDELEAFELLRLQLSVCFLGGQVSISCYQLYAPSKIVLQFGHTSFHFLA